MAHKKPHVRLMIGVVVLALGAAIEAEGQRFSTVGPVDDTETGLTWLTNANCFDEIT